MDLMLNILVELMMDVLMKSKVVLKVGCTDRIFEVNPMVSYLR